VVSLESAALSAWVWLSCPVICRLFALRDAQGLRVLDHVERAFDGNEIPPPGSRIAMCGSKNFSYPRAPGFGSKTQRHRLATKC
jgi:hypothetical protein